jgi:uncharacterized coiled-coil protein SlyX
MDFSGGSPPRPVKRDDGRREARDLHERVWDLEHRLERQAATIEALFTLLAANGLKPAALLEEVRRVEQERAAGRTKPCSRCGRAMGRRQAACVYCGEPRVVDSPFEQL